MRISNNFDSHRVACWMSSIYRTLIQDRWFRWKTIICVVIHKSRCGGLAFGMRETWYQLTAFVLNIALPPSWSYCDVPSVSQVLLLPLRKYKPNNVWWNHLGTDNNQVVPCTYSCAGVRAWPPDVGLFVWRPHNSCYEVKIVLHIRMFDFKRFACVSAGCANVIIP